MSTSAIVLTLAGALHVAACATPCPSGFVRDPQSPGQCTTEGAPDPATSEDESAAGPNWVGAIEAVQAVEGRGGTATNRRSGGARLLVFGGHNNETYLGCLCGEHEADSVTNSYGDHGSRYATDSIWNRYGDFGSKYSDASACSAHATNPPIVVSSEGEFIGHLTVNKYLPKAITDPAIVEWLELVVCSDS